MEACSMKFSVYRYLNTVESEVNTTTSTLQTAHKELFSVKFSMCIVVTGK